MDKTLSRDLKRLGRTIKVKRVYKDWTQEALAENANLAVKSVSEIERGKKIPNFATLVKVCRALDTTVAAVCTEAEL